jgi:hypothetical protein
MGLRIVQPSSQCAVIILWWGHLIIEVTKCGSVHKTKQKKNSMVWVRERTIPTERPPLVGEVTASFCGWRVPRGQRDGSLRPYSRFSRQEPLLFYQVAPQLYSRGGSVHTDIHLTNVAVRTEEVQVAKNRGSTVGMATGYGLDDRGVVYRVPVG